MFDFLAICRALSDENRLRILMALRERELCVCQVTAFLDLAPSTTSKHLSILRQARLIESSKHGRWVYYRLAGERASMLVREAVAWMSAALADDPLISSDNEKILQILKAEAECDLGNGGTETFHSLELHSLDELFSADSGDEATDCDNGEAYTRIGCGECLSCQKGQGENNKDSALCTDTNNGKKKNGGRES